MIGGAPLALVIGSRSRGREAAVGRVSRRSWGSEMEGSVSNLMVCNLAYSGKLEDLKECILADKSLATRTDQVRQRWASPQAAAAATEPNVAAWRGPSGGRLCEGQVPAPAAPAGPGVTSGLGIGRQELAPQTSHISFGPVLSSPEFGYF